MSSPIANTNKNHLQKWVIASHQKLSHSKRVQFLADRFSSIIQRLKIQQPTILDIGCGDLSIAGLIHEKIPKARITGIDCYELPETLKNEALWKNYQSYDGKHIPFEDQSFDVALLCDVLHHDMKNARQILNEAFRVSKFVLIKDHFEYGFRSRKVLQLMDIIGNWGYGVSIPDHYLTRAAFENLIRGQTEIQRICPMALYAHNKLFNFIAPGRLQFISLLKNKEI